MSIHNHASFMKNLPSVWELKHLDLPPRVPDEHPVQVYDLKVGTIVRLLNGDKDRENPMRVMSYQHYDGLGYQFLLQDVVSGGAVFLTNGMISIMEQESRFFLQSAKTVVGQEFDAIGELTEKQRATAEKKLRYVLAILHATKNIRGKITNDAIQDAAAAHAKKYGEEPLKLTVLKEAIQKYHNAPSAKLLALAPGLTRGNTCRKFSERMEELIERAVHFAWRLPKGSAQSARRRFERLLALPENRDVLEEALDGGDFLKEVPKDRTWDRRKSGVPHFMRDMLRYGEDYAERVHSIKIPQMRPTSPLDVVEVDFVKTDVTVYDERWPLYYGRAWAIFFKDRMSGAIVGHEVFFGAPNLEAFLAGFKNMLYPKDMSQYPGLENPIYGLPVALAFDADPVLRSKNVSAVLGHLNVIPYELLAAHPNSKGGLERYFRTQNDVFFHNIPGSTESNPQRRGKHDAENEMALPKVSLSELKRGLAAMVCDYNRSFHKGLGFLRTLKGVPEQRWFEGMAKALPRPPIDPEVFAAFSGEVKWLAIEHGTITWDNIVYTDPVLSIIASDGEATPPTGSGDGRKPRKTVTKYKCTRDPSNLEYVFVHAPRLKSVFRVRAAPGEYLEYARGLRLSQHHLAMKWHRKKTKRAPTHISELLRALSDAKDELVEIHEQRETQKTAEALAAFYRRMTRKVVRSQVVDVKPDPEGSRRKMDTTRNSPVRIVTSPIPRTPPAPSRTTKSLDRDEMGAPVPPPTDEPQIGGPTEAPRRKPMPKETGSVVRVETPADPEDDLSMDEIAELYRNEVKGDEA